MSDQSLTSTRKTSKASSNVIGLQASRVGVSPSDSPVYRTIFPHGREALRANLSPRQAQALGLMMSVTSGPRSTTTLRSDVLAGSLVSRLKKRLGTDGSTLFGLTWKVKITPSQQWVCLLRAQARRTSASACSSWPTATANDSSSTRNASAKHSEGSDHHHSGTTLVDAADLAISPWPTPNALLIDAKPNPPITSHRKSTDPQIGLADVAVHLVISPWPTTAARDWKGSTHEKWGDNARPLNEVARLAGWGTPTADEAGGTPERFLKRKEDLPCGKSLTALNLQVQAWISPQASDANGAGINQHTASLCQQARAQVSGDEPNLSPAGTGSSGQLNPAFSGWLMGYQPIWVAAGMLALSKYKKGS